MRQHTEDKSTSKISLTDSNVKVTGYDSNKIGTQTLTAEYQGKTVTFDIGVQKEITEITLKTMPSKLVYIKGEPLELDYGKIEVKYNDNTTTEVDMTSNDVTISGYDANILGEQTIKVTYQGLSTTFKIKVTEKEENNDNPIVKVTNTNTAKNSTTVKGVLPQTGNNNIIIKILLLLCICFTIISFIMYKRNKS